MSGTFFLRLARLAPGNGTRCALLRRAGLKIGRNVKIDRHATIWKGCRLADNVEVRRNAKVIAASIGESSVIDVGAQVLGTAKNPLVIGSHCYVGQNNILDGSGGLRIGNHVHIAGPSVGIWTHSTIKKAIAGSKISDNQYREEGPVTIGDNVWIGGLSIIYPNVIVGERSAILPGSIVNKNVKPKTVVGGAPAKLKRNVKVDGSGVIFS